MDTCRRVKDRRKGGRREEGRKEGRTFENE